MIQHIRARAALACVALLAATGLAAADPVTDWNVVALRTTAAAPFNPPVESRSLAIVHAAMFDAVNAVTHEFRAYAVHVRASAGTSADAAAVAAAHFALSRLYPAAVPVLDAAYAASLAALPDGPGKAAGIALGETVATRLLSLRDTDGASAAVTRPYESRSRPGFWRPTPPASLPALDPGWGEVRPFVLEEGSQFRPGPPPAVTSARYARDFDEIKALGSRSSVSRTQDQTNLARFWIATGPQNWNPAARQAAGGRSLSLTERARVFALLNLAGADAFIAAWDAKYAYGQWRPVTAIRAADTDGNPSTAGDPDWAPLLTTPPFPDYVAGHTTYAGAAEAVLECVFGRRPAAALILTSPTAPGVVETYETFHAMAAGVVDARVWGGIHWRTSSERGRVVGREIGRYTVQHALRPARDR